MSNNNNSKCFDNISNYNYKPLPDNLIIKKSDIHGKGLFTRNTRKNNKGYSIPENTTLGVSHIYIDIDDLTLYNVLGSKLIRTPLGGFINHSSHPNCKLIKKPIEELNNAIIEYILVTTKKIKPNEELTLDYTETICIGN